MPEFSLQDLRRLYMISALYPKQSWEFKKVAYDNSADEYGDLHRSVTSLKSYWNLHRNLWGRIHLLSNPPAAIPNDLSDTQGHELKAKNPGAQDSEGHDAEKILKPRQRSDMDQSFPNQEFQYRTSLSEQSDNYISQHQAHQTAPTFEYPISYIDQALLKVQGQQNQPKNSMDQFSADYEYNPYPLSPYPLHSATANHTPFFTDATYGQPHFANSSGGWNASFTGDVHVAAGQQPMIIASSSSAGSIPNAYVACNPSTALTPQTTHVETITPGHLAQVSEQSLPDNDMGTQEIVPYVESSGEETDGDSEEQS